jgi:hypothetical protein
MLEEERLIADTVPGNYRAKESRVKIIIYGYAPMKLHLDNQSPSVSAPNAVQSLAIAEERIQVQHRG